MVFDRSGFISFEDDKDRQQYYPDQVLPPVVEKPRASISINSMTDATGPHQSQRSISCDEDISSASKSKNLDVPLTPEVAEALRFP
jgi:hypothetical protein